MIEMAENNSLKVAIVGGGIAGATIAIYLSELGIDVSLLEKGPSLVNGPPICHLHAGGNLYPEISDQQCLTLLAQSIDILRLYPHACDYRPTVIAVPKNHSSTPQELLPRLNKLRNEYQRLIDQDIANKQLGESEAYYQLFERHEVEWLAEQEVVEKPKTLQEWMIPVAKNIELDKLQFPLIMVQEYGLNLFRLAATAGLVLQENRHCQLFMNSHVGDIHPLPNNGGWQIDFLQVDQEKQLKVDYLINAAGFRTGLLMICWALNDNV
ncbi:FAD-dependent oxidoreductase [Psychromonas sp. MME2]|uniref:FAD-dependent oxidoreductase n=1 Tax=Psychromonas sp. MME2 TaxID=3231033 RepID=UPI00339CF78D